MKLNVFNRWKPFGNFAGKVLQYQTSRVKGAKRLFATLIREAESNATIAKAYGNTSDASKEAVQALLKSAGSEAIWNAIQSGEPIVPSTSHFRKEEPKDINWRDGINHRYRAQKKIVGESEELMEKDDKPKVRNFVAKNARSVNKAGPMKDKKNDYNRKPKHKKSLEEGV